MWGKLDAAFANVVAVLAHLLLAASVFLILLLVGYGVGSVIMFVWELNT